MINKNHKLIMRLRPILSTYKTTYTKLIRSESHKDYYSFSCELNVENRPHEIEFINYLFVVSKKNNLYRYNKQKNLEQIDINEFYRELSYDQNQTFKILFDETNDQYYLYIGDYTWIHIKQKKDIIHIENINSNLIKKEIIFTKKFRGYEANLFYLKKNIFEILYKYKNEYYDYRSEEVQEDIHKQIEQKEGSIMKGSFADMNSLMLSIREFLTKYQKQIILFFMLILIIIIIIISVSIKYRTDK